MRDERVSDSCMCGDGLPVLFVLFYVFASCPLGQFSFLACAFSWVGAFFGVCVCVNVCIFGGCALVCFLFVILFWYVSAKWVRGCCVGACRCVSVA